MADNAALAKMAQKLRRLSIESTTEAGSGHPTSCMSMAEIMSVLFFDEMRWDPRDPSGRRADIFVLSKGHAAPILWAALKESGAIDDDLMTLRRHDSRLEGHPTPLVPWVRVTTGSLGQGLSVADGMAWARKLDGEQGRVYVLMGDGEVAEGSAEAAEAAAETIPTDLALWVSDMGMFAILAGLLLAQGADARRRGVPQEAVG